MFCGCGGLSAGFLEAGFSISHGIDNWKDAIETFNYNHKNSKGIIADLGTANIKELIKEHKIKSIDVVIGGPPCQGFSIAGKRNVKDERNLLYKSFLEFVKILKPKAFLIEKYAEFTGFSMERIDWYHAFACWKGAVVAAQLYQRYVNGQSKDERMKKFGTSAKYMPGFAKKLLEGKMA